MIHRIYSIDSLEERFLVASEYISWFSLALRGLSEDERFVISEYYLVTGEQRDPINNICERFNFGDKAAYKRIERAFNRLVVLLYGK